ncbi:MAG: hypothetical protein HRK26_01205 [Rickettsiaceae bacterium H1]|nr:hypothetical protein [Rickettsiaceae bacterium H1]
MEKDIEQEIIHINNFLDNNNEDKDLSEIITKVENLCTALQTLPSESAKQFVPDLEEINTKINLLISSFQEQTESTKKELKNLTNIKKANESYGSSANDS